ncbi:helix-turn-helix domain-containing protein [Rhodococcus pyridinivorans]|uniref:helix-turn-helix domain-containing protein n=1 Tax=Rhodococcus pyridinivorans TaxID=103816 RepID=UPI00368EF0E3
MSQTRSTPGLAPVVRLGDSVLVSGPAVDVMRYAVRVAIDARKRNGYSASRDLALLAESLSSIGHDDNNSGRTEESGSVGELCPDQISTDEAAQLIGCSKRTAQRLAPGLGGRQIGGRWFLDRLAVLEHIEGRDAA